MLEYTLTSYYTLWYFPKVDKNASPLICTYMFISSLPNENEGHIFERKQGGVREDFERFRSRKFCNYVIITK